MESTNPYQAPTADLQGTPGFADFDETSPFSAKGRFGRLSFIAWYTVSALVSGIISALMAAIGIGAAGITPDMMRAAGGMPWGAMMPDILLGLVFLYFYIVFGIRRLHDMNRSAWWLLLGLVPLVNLILGLVLLLAGGTAGANDYAAPRFTPTWEKVVAWIGIVLALASIVLAVFVAIPAYQAYVEAARQGAGG
jgi:uncharacterized membrane protein YhaH (DUF805 family)